VPGESFRYSEVRRNRLCDTRALVLLVVVSHVSEFLSVRIRPREPDYARLPVFRHGDRAHHHHLAGLRGRRFIGAVIHWLIGQRVEGWAPFNLVRFAIKFPHPSPLDGLTIPINPIHRALYHVTFGWGVDDRSILSCAGRELRFAFVELPSAHEGIGSKSCGCC
jgi:hypothetical protein